MAVFTPSYPLTLPTATGIRTQNWGLRRITSLTQSPFTLQQQVYQHLCAMMQKNNHLNNSEVFKRDVIIDQSKIFDNI